MVDQEVVDILAEIRQRVSAAATAESEPNHVTRENSPASSSPHSSVSAKDYSGLSILARAWDRLPPVVSNRTGTSARLELWIKSKLKRASRWFTWEQVNFNAATYHTFLDLIESLRAHGLYELREQLSSTREEVIASQQLLSNDFKDQRSALLSEISTLRAHIEDQRKEFSAQLNGQRADFQVRIEALEKTIQAIELEKLLAESRQRDERLLDEQRVCFKQLSLELSESQVLQDRARRELDARVAKLERG